jgi:plastocyanin
MSEQVPNMEIKSNGRKLGWLVVAGVVLVVVLVTLIATHKSVPQPQASLAPVITVNITDTGFVPATLAVSVGTKVTWHNQTASPHQVGSNPYPAHSDLPDFYSSQPIGPDGTYSYTFSTAGTWNYSDYTKPTVGGTVKVK